MWHKGWIDELWITLIVHGRLLFDYTLQIRLFCGISLGSLDDQILE